MNKPFLFIALDGLAKREKETLGTVERFSNVEGNFGFKANLDYLLNPMEGLKATLERLQRFGRPIFADLKMWNGTRTMASIVETLVDRGADYLNVYALADDLLPEVIQITQGSNTKVLGLTILSHYSEDYCQRHFRRSLREAVRHFARVALEAGCHGIILPGTTLETVQDLDTIKVVPGIRPDWYQDTRHEQEIEPGIAVRKGTDILVCGSPIMKSIDKVTALKKVLSEMTI